MENQQKRLSKTRRISSLPQAPELPSDSDQRGLNLKPGICKQEPDYKLLQFWCKAWMGVLFSPSVLLIDNLPSKAMAA